MTAQTIPKYIPNIPISERVDNKVARLEKMNTPTEIKKPNTALEVPPISGKMRTLAPIRLGKAMPERKNRIKAGITTTGRLNGAIKLNAIIKKAVKTLPFMPISIMRIGSI